MRNKLSFARFGKTMAGVFTAGIFCLFASASQAAMEFKLSNQFPPTHHVSASMQVFAEKVAEYSKGEMTVKIYDSSALYRDAEIVKAIRGSSVEVGLVPANKWSGMIPAVDIFDAPFAFPTQESLVKFLEVAAPLFDEAFSKYNAKVLFWVDYGFVQFFNSKRPLKTPEDFKGLTMRAYSARDAKTLKTLSAAPTIISSSEMYLALQRGTIDGADTSMPAAVSHKVIEVQKYMTEANYAAAEFLVQANLKWFNGLKKEQQNVIMKASADAERYIREKVAAAEAKAKETVIKASVEIHELTPEQLTLFIKATAPVRDIYLKNGGDLAAKVLAIADEAAK